MRDRGIRPSNSFHADEIDVAIALCQAALIRQPAGVGVVRNPGFASLMRKMKQMQAKVEAFEAGQPGMVVQERQ